MTARPWPLALVLLAPAAGLAVADGAAAKPSASPSARTSTVQAGPRQWPALRWGMSELEVLKALPGARRLEEPETLADGRVVSLELEPLALGGVDFKARFVFKQGQLGLASLKSLPGKAATAAAYDRLHAHLAAWLASPGAERRDDSMIDLRETRWDAPGERVDLKFIPGTLVVQYSPPATAP